MGSCAGAEQKVPQRTANPGQQTQDNGRINILQPPKSPIEDADIPQHLNIQSSKPIKKVKPV